VPIDEALEALSPELGTSKRIRCSAWAANERAVAELIDQAGLMARGEFPYHDFGLASGPIQRVLRVGRPHAIEGQIRAVHPIERIDFDWCPICLEPNPTHLEHVPQRGLGGSVKTLTCEPCNSGFGSRLEAALLDWYYDALVDVRISCETIPGEMREGKVYRRSSETGAPVWLFPRDIQQRTRKMLDTGTFNLSGEPPQRHVVQLALLKNAYLAACIYRRGIFVGEQADAVRADLLAARGAELRGVPTSEIADRLDVIRSTIDLKVPLGLAVLHLPDEQPHVKIVLGGSVFVAWPFQDETVINPGDVAL